MLRNNDIIADFYYCLFIIKFYIFYNIYDKKLII